jgi:FkbM family methyltransferase
MTRIPPFVRTMLEQLSRPVWIRRRLQVGDRSIRIWVSPRAGLRYWGSVNRADPGLVNLALSRVRTGEVVWDIGANVGLFGLSCAAVGGVVIAVEPDLKCAQMLRRSASSNDCSEALRVIPCAVSDRVGIASFSVARRSNSTSHLTEVVGSTQTGGSACRVDVPTITLDSLLAFAPPPNFVKIDVEGAELQVLAGAILVLGSARPVVYFEFADENIDACTELLDRAGYDVTRIDECNALAVPRI